MSADHSPSMSGLSEKFERLLAATPINLSPEQQRAQLSYLALLLEWNKIYNLTAVRQPEQMLVRHIMDSLAITPFLEGRSFIDVGSGAGLPGIPLAIAQPTWHFTLLDSLGKRMRFLQQVKQRLNLSNIELVQHRVETFMPPGPFDGIISRAFSSLQKMLEMTRHLLNAQGYFYAMKGRRVTLERELTEIPPSFQIKQIISLQIPDLMEERHLIVASLSNATLFKARR